MPSVRLLLCLALVALWLVYRRITSHLKKKAIAQKAASLGCISPPVFKLTNGLGIPAKRESIKATNEDRSPQFIASCLDSISTRCHTVRVPIFDYEILVTRDPENVRAIFSGATAADYDISASRAASWLPMLGKGIFTTRGWEWKHSRSVLRGQFARDVVADVEREERHVQCLINRILASSCSSDVEVGGGAGGGRWTAKLDLLPLFFNFTLDTASEFLYGESVHSQQGSQDGVDIAHHFHKAKVAVHRRVELDKFYWLCNSSSFRKSCAILHRWVDAIVEKRLAQLHQGLLSSTPSATTAEKKGKFVLLDELAKDAKTNLSAVIDPKQLRSETLNVLAAGRDTTGSLLGWVFYFLARHPAVYAKLRHVILETFGTHPTATKISFQDLRSCNYLQYVMKEALRVATVIPMNERTALRDTILPVGGGADGKGKVFVPEGTQILIPTYAMQHRADLWGDDVEEFVPERWETIQPGWEYIPFGAGERKCLGQQFAFTETGYVVVRMCQRFEKIENVEEGDGRIRLHHAIENRSGTGVQVRLREAVF